MAPTVWNDWCLGSKHGAAHRRADCRVRARTRRTSSTRLRFLASSSTRLEPGCLGCSAWLDPDATVRYVEEWATEADMRRRVRSERFTSLLAVIESAQEPLVQFDFVTMTRGLDYVAEVRNATWAS